MQGHLDGGDLMQEARPRAWCDGGSSSKSEENLLEKGLTAAAAAAARWVEDVASRKTDRADI